MQVRRLERTLLLGGSGFLGRRVAAALVDAGVQVAVVDARGEDIPGVECLHARVEDVDLVALVDGRGVDAVFHLAGTAEIAPSLDDPVTDLVSNAVTTLRVLASLQRAQRHPVVLYASSAVVYGKAQREPIDEDHPLRPTSPYGVSKLASEQYARLAAELHGLRTVSARIFSLYGPGQRKQVVYDLAMRLLAGENPLLIRSSADVVRDLVFVDDAARACVLLAQRAACRGEAVNIATGEPTTLEQLARALIEALGAEAEVRFTGDARPGDTVRVVGDASRARAMGIDCPTSVVEGLRVTAPWLIRAADADHPDR